MNEQDRLLSIAVRANQYACDDSLEGITRASHRFQARFESTVAIVGLVATVALYWFLLR